jgi:Skp family chaperone for outer membrane proteins
VKFEVDRKGPKTMTRFRTVVTAALVSAASLCAFAQQSSSAGGDAARETVGKWIATQRLIYQERKDWQQQKEILESRIELIGKEIAEVEAKVTEARRTAAEADAKRSDAESAKRQLADETSYLASVLVEFETAVRGLHKVLPAPVQEKIQPLFQRMPADPGATRSSVAERFQNVLGIMNEINKANGEITLVTEVRALSDGRPSEVKTVYLGLGQAYYLSVTGEAGVGRPGPDGWTWTADDDLAPTILQVVEILEGKAQPKFVPLPVKIS